MTKTRPNDWFFFAESDLKLAKEAVEEAIYHLACFHAQQAVEKLLKAVLAAHHQPIPKIHSVRELYTRVIPFLPPLAQYSERLIVLDQYYIPTRYPDALPGSLPEGLPTEVHAHEAVKDAEDLSIFIHESLSASHSTT